MHSISSLGKRLPPLMSPPCNAHAKPSPGRRIFWGGGGGGQRRGDVSFWLAPSVCETVEFVNWEPARIWALSEAEKRQLEASHNRPCNAL